MWAQYAETAVYQKVREPDMKYKIEKNTVQETLILPLYSRKLCTELYPNLYRDETAVRLLDRIDYDFSLADKDSAMHNGVIARALVLDKLVSTYLAQHPGAVVNITCRASPCFLHIFYNAANPIFSE